MTPITTTEDIVKQIELLTQDYLKKVEAYSLEELCRKPSEEDWSLGQMYVHLIQTALFMQFKNINACREGASNPAVTGNTKSETGRAVYGLGAFPPIRIQVPASPAYTPKQPESKAQIVSLFQTVLEKMRELAPVVDSIPSELTVDHPRFGGLSAREWFDLVPMHFRHHLHQQERLEQFLKA